MSFNIYHQELKARDLFGITFHALKKSFDMFWKVLEPITQISKVGNTISLKNGMIIPFLLTSVNTIVPSSFSKKQQHILIVSLSNSNVEDKILRQIKLFRKSQIEEPLVIVILVDSIKKSYKEVKEFIESEIEDYEFKHFTIKSQNTFQMEIKDKSKQKTTSLSAPSLKKKKFECIFCKLPFLEEITKSDVEKIYGLLAKSNIKREMEWKKFDVEYRNGVINCLSFVGDLFYITEQRLFYVLNISSQTDAFKNNLIKILHDYGILFSYRFSEFRNLNQPKLNYLNNILIRPWVYVDVYHRARNECFKGNFVDVSSIFKQYEEEYEALIPLILSHFAEFNDIFTLDDDLIKQYGIEDIIEKYCGIIKTMKFEEELRPESFEAKEFREKKKSGSNLIDLRHNETESSEDICFISRQNPSVKIKKNDKIVELLPLKKPKHFFVYRFIQTNDLIELHWAKKHYENELEIARKFETQLPAKSSGILIASLLLRGGRIIGHNEDFMILEIFEWGEKAYCLVEKTEKTVSFHIRALITSYSVYLSVIKCVNRLVGLLQSLVPIRKKYCYCPHCLHNGLFTPTEFNLDTLEHNDYEFKCKHHVLPIECFPDYIYEKYNSDMNVIEVKDLIKINEGSYSEIYKAIRIDTGDNIAAKVLFSKGSYESFMANYSQFVNEIEVSKKCKSPSLLELISYSINDMTLYYEYCDGGNLYGYIESHLDPFPESVQISLILDIAKGIGLLHKKGFIHRDIKSPNILIKTNPLRCVLCDFGLCKPYGPFCKSVIDNPIWCAPEILQGNASTRSSDVYSFSIVVWEIVSFQHPFQYSFSMSRLTKDIIKGDRPDISEIPNEVLKNICEEGWDEDPYRRPTMREIENTLKSLQ